MKKAILLCLFVQLAATTTAQLSVSAFAHAGPAWISEEPLDGTGTNRGVGVALHYAALPLVGSLSLSLSREQFSGFNSKRHFSQLVPRFEAAEPATAVSVVLHRKGLAAYRIMASGEYGLDKVSPRLRVACGVGAILVDRNAAILVGERVEQEVSGEFVPQSFFQHRFIVEDGQIVRVPATDLRVTQGLHRARLASQLQLAYQLSSDVRLLLSWEQTYGSLGKRYGEGNSRNMLGNLSYVRIGLQGRLFGESPTPDPATHQ